VGAVDEGLGQIEFAALGEISRERGEHLIEDALALPPLKAPMTRLVGRIARRHVGPRGTGSQHPKDAVENVARIAPRSPSLFARSQSLAARDQTSNDFPLLVGEIHVQLQNRFRVALKAISRKQNNFDRLRE
jgi:hypothetical protein